MYALSHMKLSANDCIVISTEMTDKVRVIEMDGRSKLTSECHELRAQLKEWERAFAETNGRKPGKEDINKNPDIAARYKTYNRTKDVLDGKKDFASFQMRSPSVRQKSSTSLRRSEQDHGQTPTKILFSTPRKGRQSLPEVHPSILDPYDSPAASVSPHPYAFKSAIGPTPQRDGKLLGLFDFLSNSGSTPSTRKRKADALDEGQRGMHVAQTPSRKPMNGDRDLLEHLDESFEGRRHSRTPTSDGKKFLLSQFLATPSTMRLAAITEEDSFEAIDKMGLDQTPLRSKVLGQAGLNAHADSALETTPAYLRRATSFNQRLLIACGSNPERTGPNDNLAIVSPTAGRKGPTMRAFKGRALSEIARGLRQVDALRELEGNEINALVGDSQVMTDAPAGEQETTRNWRKRGQKRTTRRVTMRPATVHRKPRKAELGEGERSASDESVARVHDSQLAVSITKRPAQVRDDADDLEPLLEDPDNKENHIHVSSSGSDNEFIDSDSEPHDLKSTPPSKKRRLRPASEANAKSLSKSVKTMESSLPSDQGQSAIVKTTTKKTEQQQQKQKKKQTTKGVINPNAHSHLNFRSLKIRNKQSKAKAGFGKGRARR